MMLSDIVGLVLGALIFYIIIILILFQVRKYFLKNELILSSKLISIYRFTISVELIIFCSILLFEIDPEVYFEVSFVISFINFIIAIPLILIIFIIESYRIKKMIG